MNIENLKKGFNVFIVGIIISLIPSSAFSLPKNIATIELNKGTIRSAYDMDILYETNKLYIFHYDYGYKLGIFDISSEKLVSNINLNSYPHKMIFSKKLKKACAFSYNYIQIIDLSNESVLTSISISLPLTDVVIDEINDLVYVLGNSSTQSKIFIINLKTNSLIDTITISSRLSALALDDSSQFLYSYGYNSTQGKAYIIKIDLSSYKIVSELSLKDLVYDWSKMIYDKNTKKLYLVLSSYLYSIDSETGTINKINTIFWPEDLIIDSDKNRLYISSYYNSTSRKGAVYLLNTLTDEIINSISVDLFAYRLVFNQSRDKMFLLHSYPVKISIIDISTNSLVKVVNLSPTFPKGITVNPATKKAYVSSGGLHNSIFCIDTLNNSLIKEIPVSTSVSGGDVSIHKELNRAYIANEFYNNIIAFDLNSEKEISIIQSPGRVGGLGIDENNYYLYASYVNYIDPLLIVDAKTNTALDSIFLGNEGWPKGVAVNPLTKIAYVADYALHKVKVVDLVNKKLLTTINVGYYPLGVAVNINKNLIYVTNSGSNTVSVIDGAKNIVIENISVGSYPQGITINQKTGRIYVANFRNNTVSVISSPYYFLTDISVGKNPHSVTVDEETNRIYVTNNYDGTISVFEDISIDETPPDIQHTPVSSIQPDNAPVKIKAEITDDTKIFYAVLSYRYQGTYDYDSVFMKNTYGSTYEAEIPISFLSESGGRIVEYFIDAIDQEGNYPVTGEIPGTETEPNRFPVLNKTPPLQVSNFTGGVTSDGKVLLKWKISTSIDAAKYNIYSDNSSGIINYSSPITSIQHPNSSVILPIDTGQYLFGIRACDSAGNEEKNGNIFVYAEREPASWLKASSSIMSSTTVINDNTIYAISNNNVLFTNIKNDGSLDQWKSTSPPNMNRIFFGTSYKNRIYVVATTNYYNIDILSADINSDGTLSMWKNRGSVSYYSYPSSILTHKGKLYVITGSVIRYSTINEDGSLGQWNFMSIPYNIYFSSAVIFNNKIYLIGGFTYFNSYPIYFHGSSAEVLYADINADGSIGQWKKTTPLPEARYWHSTIIINGKIYLTAGSYYNYTYNSNTGSWTSEVWKEENNCWYAEILPSGEISRWVSGTNLPSSISKHSSVEKNGILYLTTNYDIYYTKTKYFKPWNSDDTISPDITEVFPDSNTFINTGEIKFKVNEPLKQLTVSFSRISGAQDSSLHTITLNSENIKVGYNTISFNSLVDEIIYQLKIQAYDTTGNYSEVIKNNIGFDISSPVSKIIYPSSNTAIDTSPVISGTAYDVLSGVKQVKLLIENTSDSTYWSGSSWTKDITLLIASGTKEWQYNSTEWIKKRKYSIAYKSIDNLNNEEKENKIYFVLGDILSPEPVTNLSVTLLKEAKIYLSWSSSTSIDAAKYNIYIAKDEEKFDYLHPSAYVEHPKSSWISSALSVGSTYRFVVRVVDKEGNEEINENSVSIKIELLGEASATIKVPKSEKRIKGNAVTIIAEASDNTRYVQFQFRKDKEWTNISTPDAKLPYSVYWNTSGLKNGAYELRTVAYDTRKNPDTYPETIKVIIDDVNAEIIEDGNTDVDPNGEHRKIELVKANSYSEIVTKDGTSAIVKPQNFSSQLEIAVLDKERMRPFYPPDESSLKPLGIFRKFEFKNGQTKFENNISLIIPYSDEDNDGIVDGTDIKEKDVRLYYMKNDSGEWIEIKTMSIIPDSSSKYALSFSSIEKKGNYILASVNHFTLFGLFYKAPSANLNVIVYPNPYKPYDGDSTTGYAGSGIIFDGLTKDVKIRIFTISGRLVREIDITTDGSFQYDVRNDEGEELASGVYIYIITNGREISKGKFAIIR